MPRLQPLATVVSQSQLPRAGYWLGLPLFPRSRRAIVAHARMRQAASAPQPPSLHLAGSRRLSTAPQVPARIPSSGPQSPTRRRRSPACPPLPPPKAPRHCEPVTSQSRKPPSADILYLAICSQSRKPQRRDLPKPDLFQWNIIFWSLPDSLRCASFWHGAFFMTVTSLDSILLGGIFFSGLKHPMQLIFSQLNNGPTLNIVLWGERVTAFPAEQVYRDCQTSPQIIIFVGTLVRSYVDNVSLSGGSSCKWYINAPVPEVSTLKARHQPVIWDQVASVVEPSTFAVAEQKKKKIRDIKYLHPFEKKDDANDVLDGSATNTHMDAAGKRPPASPSKKIVKKLFRDATAECDNGDDYTDPCAKPRMQRTRARVVTAAVNCFRNM